MAANASEHDFLAVLHWLEDRIGLKFRDDQRAGTIVIIRRVMDQLNISRPLELRDALNSHSAVMDQLVNQLTVGETYFFREAAQFDLIRETIIPEIINRRGLGHTIRAWSAGCASGEEAYSLAIVFHQQLHAGQFNILATDISEAALRKARQAVFRPWSLRGNAMAAAEPYMIPKDDAFQLRENIKSRVTFRPLNLAANIYPSLANGTSDVDLILCRNVLIYFGHDTIREIGERLCKCLAPGGWLLTASGDPSLSGIANFETVATKTGIAYRKSTQANALIPRRQDRSSEFYQESSEPQESSKIQATSGPDRSASDSTRRPPPTLRSTTRSSDGTLPRATTARATTDDSKGWKSDVDRPGKQAAIGSASEAAASPSSHDLARTALGSGNFERAVKMTENLGDDPVACQINVKATAAIDSAAALEKCRTAVGRHALSEELHYLYGVLLVDANRNLEALQSLQKVIFLNRSLVMPHFLFGSIQLQHGQLESARRHFRNVCELCALRPPDQIVPLSDGETVADIAIAAEAHLEGLDAIETDA